VTGGPFSDMQIATYYFPGYHAEPRMEALYGPGWTEWELMRRAEPRFPGHRQPLKPAWGEEDECTPSAMAKKIDAATRHGVDAFLFDWYWYEDKPFLNRPLDETFLGEVGRFPGFKFALMWANHDWSDLFPAKHFEKPKLLFKGAVTWQEWEHLTDFVIAHYFKHPNYWRVGGKPYFSVFHGPTFLTNFGGAEGARSALRHFEAKTVAAGLPGIHFNMTVNQLGTQLNLEAMENLARTVSTLGLASITHYALINFFKLPDFPFTDYRAYTAALPAFWKQFAAETSACYLPSLSMGWDVTPRTVQSSAFKPGDYPFTPIVRGNDPAAFREAVQLAADHLATRPVAERILIVNAWNEWTEGSYLEPDTENGFGYLEALRDVKASALRRQPETFA
jgi:hypothetical protein